MPVTRHFLGWDKPVLEAAVPFLAAGWSGRGVLDLRHCLVVVPTRHAGRRLRHHLAMVAGDRGTGVLAPCVVPPEFLVSGEGGRVAGRGDMLAALVAVLRSADLARLCPNLVPPAAARPDLRWLLAVAEQLLAVRRALGEAGLQPADVAARLAAGADDPVRWRELAAVEDLYLADLERLGLTDPERARRAAARDPRLPDGVTRVVVLAVPDPLPLAVTALASLAQRLPVDVCVHAPPDLAEGFDAWGRPRGEVWLSRPLDIPDDVITLVAKPADQAQAVLQWLDRGTHPSDLAVGVPDSQVVPHLERRLRERGVPAFDPAGRPLTAHPLHRLLSLGLDLAATERYESFSDLCRTPEWLAYLDAQFPGLDAAALLEGLDRLQNEHLPASFPALAARAAAGASWPEVSQACAAAADAVAGIRSGALGEALLGFLRRVCAARRPTADHALEQGFADAAVALGELVTELDRPAVARAGFSLDERAAMLAALSRSALCFAEPQPGAVELEGWLELHWNNAPCLVVTGLNEECVPQSVVGHAFLPDSLRRALDLAHNDSRAARDSYLLAAMFASRQGPGQAFHVVLGKSTDEGDVRKPSRLLFRCADTALAARALALFRDAPEGRPAVPWQLAWRLRPPTPVAPRRISVTAFRDYLACPFRFYLKHVLRMETLDDRKSELDAADFGAVCHAALEAFAREDGVRESTDADDIAAFLVAAAERHLCDRLGDDLPAAVRVQAVAVAQRLRHAARVQAAERLRGWHVLPSPELRLGTGNGVSFHGLWVRGQVDRVDRHDDGRYRVLDYKTADQATSPEAVHLGAVRETTPDYARVRVGGKDRRWVDLQLPLYALFLQGELGEGLECGYFCLPKAVRETQVMEWSLSAELLTAAERCAQGVVEAVAGGVFWPPAERVEYDDFETLFFGPAGECVQPPVGADGRAGA